MLEIRCKCCSVRIRKERGKKVQQLEGLTGDVGLLPAAVRLADLMGVSAGVQLLCESADRLQRALESRPVIVIHGTMSDQDVVFSPSGEEVLKVGFSRV